MPVAPSHQLTLLFGDGRLALPGQPLTETHPSGVIADALAETLLHPAIHRAPLELEDTVPGIGPAMVVPARLFAAASAETSAVQPAKFRVPS